MRLVVRGALATVIGSLIAVAPASAALLQVSSDPFTNASSQHATQVEPDTFAFGSTIVGAFQSGRFFNGGSSDIGWARSGDGGSTWTHGFLPGITKWHGNGRYERVSDPAVAYDAKHKVWLIVSLPLLPSLNVPAVLVSRSSTGGTSWGNPITAASAKSGQDFDKTWIVCDDTASSPFYGHCYVTFDDFGNGNTLKTVTSTNGGLTWGAQKNTADNATGIGAQPVVQPNGTVIVPADNAFEGSVISYRSTNGGASWSATTTVASILSHGINGSLRAPALPSAEIDGAGKVYVSWYDCRFRPGCSSNDIVYSTTTNGVTWSAVKRVPIDPTKSTVDHFIPGLAVDKNTSGASTHLALTYYFYPTANCTTATCRLAAGFVSSNDAGAVWTKPRTLAGPMHLTWLANTSQGYMVGDYISTSFAGGTPHPIFADATPPTGSVFHEAAYTFTGLPAAGSQVTQSPTGERPVAGARSDHARPGAPLTSR